MRERLRKWCDNGLERITADLEDLQMHKAIRNLTRLFERIQDFEKRLKKRGQLDRADAEALVAAILLLARALPFAPHVAEAILLDSGRVEGRSSRAWPDAAGIPVAVVDTPASWFCPLSVRLEPEKAPRSTPMSHLLCSSGLD